MGVMERSGHPYPSRGRLTSDALEAFHRLNLTYNKRR